MRLTQKDDSDDVNANHLFICLKYMYHAHSRNSTRAYIALGVTINTNALAKVLSNNETNIFIKLSFKEI